MKFSPSRLSAAILLSLSASSSMALAASGEPVGPAQAMHPVVEEPSAAPVVAATPEGRRVEVYLAGTPNGTALLGAYHYNPATFPLPYDFVVATGEVGWPALALTSSGRFAVAWEQGPDVNYASGIRIQGFSHYGGAEGDSVAVSTTLASDFGQPYLATNRTGTRYLAAWATQGEPDAAGSYRVRARLMDSMLGAVGEDVRIDIDGAGYLADPLGVAVKEDGSGYVAWTGYGLQVPSVAGSILVRPLSTLGEVGAPVEVAPYYNEEGTVIINEHPAIALGVNGELVVVWRENMRDGQSGAWFSVIKARRYNSDLLPLSNAFVVSEPVAFVSGVESPQVAFDGLGGFSVSWTVRASSGGNGSIYLRRFDAEGVALDLQTLVQGDVDKNHLLSRLAVDADGDTSVAWTSLDQEGTPTAMARRFRGSGQVELATEVASPAAYWHQGGVVDFEVRVANQSYDGVGHLPDGANTATALAVDIDLPEGTSLIDAFGYRWACDGQGPVHCVYENVLAPVSYASTLVLRLQAPAVSTPLTLSARVSAEQDDPALWNNDASATTQIADLVPDAFAFAAISGVVPGSEQISEAITVSGIDGPVEMFITTGEYSLNGGAYTTAYTSVNNGDSVRVRHVAASGFAASKTSTLYIGGEQAQFVTTTAAQDTTPDAFAFAAVDGVARGSQVTSDEITIAGINSAAAISVSGGSYSVDGGAFTTVAASVTAGQRVRVRHAASSAFSTPTQSVLTVGGVAATFVSTTEAMDTVPDALSLIDQNGVATGRTITSAAVTVAGINAPATISVSGGSYRINGGSFTTAAGTVQAGDQVQVQHNSATSSLTAVNTTLTIGGVSDTFTSTTGSADTTPNAFAFTDVSDARRGRIIYSNTVTVSGINATTPVSIAGSNGAYSKNGGAYTTASGTVNNGDTLRLRLTSSATANATVSTTLTMGGVSDTWSVTSGKR